MCGFPLMCLLSAWLAGPMTGPPSGPALLQVGPSTMAGSGSTAGAADAALTPLPAARERFEVGTMTVQRFGDRGPAVILVPGLESGPWSWADVIRHLQATHRVYAVTLAGFDGVPAPKPDPAAGNLLDRADQSLHELITTRHLDKPVLVGHSIGGTLALRFAGEHPELLGGAVAVDGLPVFPGMQDADAGQRKAAAGRMKQQLAGMSPAQFKAYAGGYMQRVGVIDPDLAAAAVPHLVKSDPEAVAAYAAADMEADYRPGLAKAKVPILEIMPYYDQDRQDAQNSPQAAMFPDEAGKLAFYRGLLSNAPDARVVAVKDARHFVMLDQPRAFTKVLDTFLHGLSREHTP